jgi:hypothetical protein
MVALASAAVFVTAGAAFASAGNGQTAPAVVVENGNTLTLSNRFEAEGARVALQVQQWLQGPVRVTVRNEVDGKTDSFESKPTPRPVVAAAKAHALSALGLSVTERCSAVEHGLAWDFEFSGAGPRVGHEVTIELPVLTEQLQVFTPGERGIMALSAYPTFAPVPYGTMGWSDGRCYVLPLVSVLDPQADTALTVAVPADANTPHLQIDWINAKTLRLRLGHRGMGAGTPSSLRLLFYAHPADYRAAIKAYSDDFPRYFRPVQPRGPYEGAFWYHHIHDHPEFNEMARQKMRYIWTSFWFTHLGEYLPEASQWEPYSYASWWKLKEPMSDVKINAFIDTMHAQKIGVFAYFNVTEYGGNGGRSGDAETAGRILREQFSDALIKNAEGRPVGTWEGAMAMSARRDGSLFPALKEQLRRHVTRLPQLDGFIVDRLDWASRIDYGHDDGMTMVGNRPAENMAGPVAEGVAEVCRQSHDAGWRVYVNQFWRVEVLRDNDGICHESDHVRALGYVSPFRPAAAWNKRAPYSGDLLKFEAQLKRRLQFALFPQMIAHQFPISQQAPSARASDLLEVYAPLFETLDGKEQVLTPHCVSVSGANDVNLFVNRSGHYVAPVTSRVRFLSRRTAATEVVKVRLSVTNAAALAWAYVVSADGPPCRAAVTHAAGTAEIAFDRHGTSSMIVTGCGQPSPLPMADADRLRGVRDRLFPKPGPAATHAKTPPKLKAIQSATLLLSGANLGEPGLVSVVIDDRPAGNLKAGVNLFPVALSAGNALPARLPRVQLVAADEGTWFAPQRADLHVTLANGKRYRVASWTPENGVASAGGFGSLALTLAWQPAEEVVQAAASFDSRDTSSGGNWKGRLGKRAAWMPQVSAEQAQNGYGLQPLGAEAITWQRNSSDPRVPETPKAGVSGRNATCWHQRDSVSFAVTPPDNKPYRLSVYLLDFDRNGRAMTARVLDAEKELDSQTVTQQETAGGVYLTWTVTGKVNLALRKTAGANAVASGVFIDRVQTDEGMKVLHTVSCPGLDLGVTQGGSLVGVKASTWLTQGGISLDSTKADTPKVSVGTNGSVVVERDVRGQKSVEGCRLIERFIPERDSIRWEVEITGSGAPWSTVIDSALRFAVTPDLRHWTTWTNPTRMTGSPEWGDPLETAAFGDRKLQYGGRQHDSFTVPLVTVMNKERGLSLIQSPADALPSLDLRTGKDGSVSFLRHNCRIAQERPLRFTMHLVPHGSGWRPGLNWMVNRYSEFFNPPSAVTWQVAGNGAYAEYEGDLDVPRYMRMGFTFNWKAGLDYLYMGMFLPLTDDIDWQWTNTRAWGAESPKKPTSIRQLRDYSERMRQSGFHVLNYFNLGEVGLNVKTDGAPPRKAVRDEDLWRDSNDFVWYQMHDAHFFRDDKRLPCWENGLFLDPANPAYCEFLLDQIRRHIKHFPASSGVAADRPSWRINTRGDDGITWYNGKPGARFADGWMKFWSKAGALLHPAGKVAYANPLFSRLDLYKDIDGLYVEDTRMSSLNRYAFLALRKPLVQWGGLNEGVSFDDDFQWNLYLGTFKTAPFPFNNHNIKPDFGYVDQFSLDYGPLFDAYSARTWVLDGAEAKAEGAKANLFAIPGGYLVPVIMGGNKTTTGVRVAGLKAPKELAGFTVEVLHPATGWSWKSLASKTVGAELLMDVPLVRGCALVRLSHTRMLPERRYFYAAEVDVALETRFKNAKIHYTLDGSDPTKDSPVCTGSFKLARNTLVKAQAFAPDGRALSGILMREFVKTRPPAPELSPATAFLNKPVTVTHRIPEQAELTGAMVRYTRDGTEPTPESPLLEPQLAVENPGEIKARVFWNGQASETSVSTIRAVPPVPPRPNVSLSDLPLLSEKCQKGWTNRTDRSTAGNPLRIGGKEFAKGKGSHANSTLMYAVKPEWKRFVAQVGIDDETLARPVGSAVFILKAEIVTGNEEAAKVAGGQANIIAMGGEKTLYQSPKLSPGIAWGIDIPLPPGTKTLQLIIWDAGDAPDSDHADWADAGFITE